MQINFWHKHRVLWKQIAPFITDCECKLSAKANLSLVSWLNVNSAALLNVSTASPQTTFGRLETLWR